MTLPFATVVTLRGSEAVQQPVARLVRLRELDELCSILQFPVREIRKPMFVGKMLGLVTEKRDPKILAVQTLVCRAHDEQTIVACPPSRRTLPAIAIVIPASTDKIVEDFDANVL
jgi:hypothetical protein